MWLVEMIYSNFEFIETESNIGTTYHFMSTLSQWNDNFICIEKISVALREATSSSLVIIDEFGQGTSDIDGSALLISCMEYWISQSGQSPLILVATHLHNAADFLMKSNAVTSKAGSNVRFMSMAYTCQEDELIFLYEPTDNLCGNSFPFSVAQAAGVPKSIIDRGKEVFSIMLIMK